MDSLNFNSVETLPNLSARAAFQVNSSAVFKEDVDIVPVIIDDTLSYMPWGGDNNMPFDILKLIEDDETLCCLCGKGESVYDQCGGHIPPERQLSHPRQGTRLLEYARYVCQRRSCRTSAGRHMAPTLADNDCPAHGIFLFLC